MTTLIKNVYVVDGSGHPPFKGDVLLRGSFIAATGSFPSFKADEVILGNEQFFSPGFIDINASSDKSLSMFINPSFGDFLIQGITTALLGQCGFSLAPSLYGRLHGYHSRELNSVMNSNWKSFKEFLDVISSKYNFGVNVASLSGHRVIRDDIVFDDEHFQKLSAGEMRILRQVLVSTMQQGSFGLSTGLGYPPYKEISYHELRALADVVAQERGLYTTHIRDEVYDVFGSVKEVIKLAQDTSVRTVISHLRPFLTHENEFEKTLESIEGKFSKAHVYFDINPFPYSALRVDSFLPKRMQNIQQSVVLPYLDDQSVEKELLNHLPPIGIKNAVILSSPDMPFLKGVPLNVFAKDRHINVYKALIEFMKISKLRGVLFYKNLNSKSITKGILSSQSLISTNSSHSIETDKFVPDRATKTFTEFIRQADSIGMPIEKAVAKITSIPASLIGIEKRGMITSGFYGDCVMFSKKGEVSNVFVNGKKVVSDGKLLKDNANSGVVLRKVKNK